MSFYLRYSSIKEKFFKRRYTNKWRQYIYNGIFICIIMNKLFQLTFINL